MRIHVSSGRWITDYSASLCHCWISPNLHRLTEVIRLFSHQVHPSWSSWQPKALGELRHEIVGIPREVMSNNLLEPVTILDLCFSCFKLAERIRFPFSLCTVCSLLWSKKGALLGMCLSFCKKEQITSFPLHWSKVFIYPLQSSQQLLVKYQCRHWMLLRWLQVPPLSLIPCVCGFNLSQSEKGRPAQTSPLTRLVFSSLCVASVLPKSKMWQSFVSPVKCLLEVLYKTTGSWLLQMHLFLYNTIQIRG